MPLILHSIKSKVIGAENKLQIEVQKWQLFALILYMNYEQTLLIDYCYYLTNMLEYILINRTLIRGTIKVA